MTTSTTTTTKPMSITITSCQSFWDFSSSMIAETAEHPFLVQMVDGTLPDPNFRYYVIQDALYLQDFADCLRRLSETAPTLEDSERLVAFAKGAEEAEMSLHTSFFKTWNITEQANGATQMPHTLLYTSYMKRIVTTKSHAQGLAVLLPCFWVYMHVGKCMLQLRQQLDAKDDDNGDEQQQQQQQQKNKRRCRPPQYDSWIDMYGGEEFEQEVQDYIAMVDRAITKIRDTAAAGGDDTNNDIKYDDNELYEMNKHFVMSCKLEHMFWDQAMNMMEWPTIGGM